MQRNIGEIIRLKIREDSRSAKVICEELGMSRGNLDKIYKKDSINTDLLAKMCILLDFDFFKYVNPFRAAEPDIDNLQSRDGVTEYKSNANKIQRCLNELHEAQKDLDNMEKQFGMLKANLLDKDYIISLQKDKLQLLQDKLDQLKA